MKLILLWCLWVLCWPGLLAAHGVTGEVTPGGIAVAYRYSSGEVMSFARVTVVSPADGKTFQVGNADRHGRFCFYPDTPGDWQVTADDTQGHRLTLTVPVHPDQLHSWQVHPPTTAPISRLERILTGVSFIFGLAGIVFYWQARKELQG